MACGGYVDCVHQCGKAEVGWDRRLRDVVGDVVDESFCAFAGAYVFDVHVGLYKEDNEIVVVSNARVETT